MKKSVFITGAAANTGLDIARKFAKEGYNVFVGSRNPEKAAAAAAELSEKYGVFSKGYGTKVLDEQNIKEIFYDISKIGYSVDCLVLCAAHLGVGQSFFDVTAEEFSEVINTNIVWNFLLVREAAIQMKKNGGGSVVFINSNTAYRAIPDRIAYSASKGGQLGMMRAMALDLGKYNIRVNAVLPGMIITDRWEKNPEFYAKVPSRFTPLGKVAKGADIADAVWYFAEHAENTTGAELTVDGGNMIQLYPIIPE